MKLVIDGYNIALPQGTGVATYGRNLARTAASLGHEVGVLLGKAHASGSDNLLNEIALADAGPPLEGMGRAVRYTRTVLGAARGVIKSRKARRIDVSGDVVPSADLALGASANWNAPYLFDGANVAFRASARFTRVELPDPVDLMHWTYPLPLRLQKARNVYTLHDLVPLRLPYATADAKRSYYRLCRRIAREADHILTVSECSRQDIIRLLGADESRVTNIYQASDIASLLDNTSEADIASYVEGLLGVEMRGYYLFFGAIEPKKNLFGIIEGFLESGSTARLVIIGGSGWGSDAETRLLEAMPDPRSGGRIVRLPYLPRRMLARVIAGARAVVFPSLYEGFGLPLLEAMTLGTPAITSDVACLREIGGDAATYVDPRDARAIAAAIKMLDGDAALRTELSRRGLTQARRFSAETYRQRLARFYAELR